MGSCSCSVGEFSLLYYGIIPQRDMFRIGYKLSDHPISLCKIWVEIRGPPNLFLLYASPTKRYPSSRQISPLRFWTQACERSPGYRVVGALRWLMTLWLPWEGKVWTYHSFIALWSEQEIQAWPIEQREELLHVNFLTVFRSRRRVLVPALSVARLVMREGWCEFLCSGIVDLGTISDQRKDLVALLFHKTPLRGITAREKCCGLVMKWGSDYW
jgi:hypothetical protein